MYVNLVVVCGRVAAEPEHRRFESGTDLIRLLITTRTDTPTRRIDVLPVTIWDPDPVLLEDGPRVGEVVWVSGRVQRRFWDDAAGRRSRLEIVAEHVSRRGDPELVSPIGG